MDEPAGLGERGTALWQSMASEDVPRNALVLEAARTADRLDELDNIIQGKGVLNLMQFRVLSSEITDDDRNINVEVKFAAPLAEARQQAMALAGLLSKLVPADSKAAAGSAPAPAGNVTPLDAIRQRGLKKA